MQVKSAALAATIFASTSVTVSAATADGDFAVYGWGARDCNAITAILNGDQAAQAQGQIAEWMSGYISARNRNEEGVYDLTPIKSHFPLVSLARNICANNSDQLFESVVQAMIDRFSTMRLSENSPTVTVTRNDRSVSVNQATVRRVQEFLISTGDLDGAADGQFGPNTASALESWQTETDLTVTGLPDMVTLFVMAQELDE